MPNSAPGPNTLAIPGAVPCNFIAGGGGDGGGGSSGSGQGGSGQSNTDAEVGGDESQGGKKVGDPVCPITGKVLLEYLDFAFWAVKPLRFIRHYNSKRSDVSGAFGYGWTHPLGWRAEVQRRRVLLFDTAGNQHTFPKPTAEGDVRTHSLGWRLRRLNGAYWLDKPDGERLCFEWHAPSQRWLLHKVSDLRGNSTTVLYDERGHFKGFVDSEGRAFEATLDLQGRVTQLRVALDPQRSHWQELGNYSYDAAGDLVEFRDAVGYSWLYRYDAHLLVEHRLPTGLSFFYLYDGRDERAYCVEAWGEYRGADDVALRVPISARPAPSPPPPPSQRSALGAGPRGIHHNRFEYVKELHSSHVLTGLGGAQHLVGDAAGRVLQIVDADGSLTDRHFDPDHGGLVRQSGGDNDPVTTDRADHGEPLGFTRADGSGRAVTDSQPFTRTILDRQTGAVTTVQFNEYGQRIAAQFPDGTFEVTEYDERGLVTHEVHRNGSATSYLHDAMGNPIELRHPNGGVERRVFDYLGRCVRHESEAGDITEFTYDARSEVVLKRLHDGTELRAHYDALRNLTTLQIAQRVHHFEYGGFGWMTRHVNPDGAASEYRYDVEGNLVWVRNERGQEYSFERDLLGRIVAGTDFEGLREKRVLGAEGQVLRHRTPAGEDVLSYDAQRRLIGAETADQSVTLEYAPTGGVARVDNGVVTVVSEYDALGRFIAEQQGPLQLRYGWFAGYVETIEANVGVKLQLDQAAGVPSALHVGRLRVGFAFPRACAKLFYLGEHLVRRDHFDQLGFLRWSTLSRFDRSAGVAEDALGTPGNPQQLLLIEYTYNAHGELVAEQRSDGRRVEYSLDAAGRITEKRVFQHGTLRHAEPLRYDPTGGAWPQGVSPDALFRPHRCQNDEYHYDHAGRLSRRVTDAGTWEYHWDALGNLVRVNAPRHRVELDYDARGRRMEKRVLRDGALHKQVRYGWDNEILVYEADVTTGWTRTYFRELDNWAPLGHVDSDGQRELPCFYFSDRSGMPDLAFDAHGQRVWAAERSVYGALEVAPESSVDVRARFAGQLYDEDVELVYNRMRWYEPRLAAYVTLDSLGLGGGLNLRAYVDNPTAAIDPMGEARSLPPPRPAAGAKAVGNYPTGYGARPDKPTSSEELKGWYMLWPGHFATNGTKKTPGSIACRESELNAPSKDAEFHHETRPAINAAGRAYGCHTCGSRHPLGPHMPQDKYSVDKAFEACQQFVPDHIAPAAFHTPRGKIQTYLMRDGVPENSVRLFPQCQTCSQRQGSDVSARVRLKDPDKIERNLIYRDKTQKAAQEHFRVHGA